MNDETASRAIRVLLLATTLASMILIGLHTAQYTRFFALPGARALTAETILLLIGYCLIIGWPERRVRTTLRPLYATRLGITAALVQVIHLFLERFVRWPRPWDGVVTLGFMVVTFLIWAAAGFQARTRNRSFNAACIASGWCAIVSMSLTVLVGMLLEWWIAPLPLKLMRDWAEFQRSGWNDLNAFAIANVLDSASSHLIEGPLIALVFGAAGYTAARLAGSPPRLHAEPEP